MTWGELLGGLVGGLAGGVFVVGLGAVLVAYGKRALMRRGKAAGKPSSRP